MEAGERESNTVIKLHLTFPLFHIMLVIFVIICHFRPYSFLRIDLIHVDGFIVGDLCLGQPAYCPVGEEGFVRHFDPKTPCRAACNVKR